MLTRTNLLIHARVDLVPKVVRVHSPGSFSRVFQKQEAFAQFKLVRNYSIPIGSLRPAAET